MDFNHFESCLVKILVLSDNSAVHFTDMFSTSGSWRDQRNWRCAEVEILQIQDYVSPVPGRSLVLIRLWLWFFLPCTIRFYFILLELFQMQPDILTSCSYFSHGRQRQAYTVHVSIVARDFCALICNASFVWAGMMFRVSVWCQLAV